jgi:hypothetical protein
VFEDLILDVNAASTRIGDCVACATAYKDVVEGPLLAGSRLKQHGQDWASGHGHLALAAYSTLNRASCRRCAWPRNLIRDWGVCSPPAAETYLLLQLGSLLTEEALTKDRHRVSPLNKSAHALASIDALMALSLVLEPKILPATVLALVFIGRIHHSSRCQRVSVTNKELLRLHSFMCRRRTCT